MATRSETSKSFEKFRKNLISARTARRIGGVAIFVIAWQLAADAGIPGIENVPKPSAWIAESIDYVQTEDYYLSVLGSMRRVASGYVIAAGAGIPLGLFMGLKIAFKNWTFPTFEILRPVPPIAWIPLAVIMFPTVESSVLFLIFIGAFFPIVINTMLGVLTIPTYVAHAASSLGARGKDHFRHVILPGVTPAMITGLAIGMGLTWDMVVAAEMVAGGHGLGYNLWYYYILLQYDRVILFMVSVGAAGYLYSAVVRKMGGKYVKWRQMV